MFRFAIAVAAAALCTVSLAAVHHVSAAGISAGRPLDITLPGTRVFPESLTSIHDGTIIVGSRGHNNVMRIPPNSGTAVEWIRPGTGGLGAVYGVFADERNKLLWVCSDKLAETPVVPSVKTFDLKTGAPKGSYALPGDNAFCNDIAIREDKTAYITDTAQATVWMLKPGATALEAAAKDPLLETADGLAFGDKDTLYVNGVRTGKFLRVSIGPDGKSTSVVELKTPRKLVYPDGMRTIGKNRFLMAEGGGTMSVVTLDGNGGILLDDLKEGMVSTPGVTLAKGIAWVCEGKLNYMNDPALKDKDPGEFQLYGVPLPIN
jgi:sugar lactone lactonase YvrE